MKVVLSGPGLIGLDHLKNINKNSRLDLVGIVAPNNNKHNLLAKQQNTIRFDSVQEACDVSKPDGVILCSPTHLHKQQAKEALSHTPYVFIEKPIFSDTVDLKDFACFDVSKVCIGHHRNSGSQLNQIGEITNAASIGEIVSISGHAVFKKPPDYFEKVPWRLKSDGGGVLSINLIHEIGIMRKIAGEIVEVSAFTRQVRLGSQVEDSAVINFLFQSNALGSFVISDAAVGDMSWEHNSGENPNFPHTEKSCYFVFGTDGMIEFPNPRKIYYESEKSWLLPTVSEEIIPEINDPLYCTIDNFVDVFENKAHPNVTFVDGVRNLRVIEAIRKSSQRGRKVTVIYDD